MVFNWLKFVIVEKLLWYKINNTLQDMLFKENNQLQDGNNNSARYRGASHIPSMIIFLQRHVVFYFLLSFNIIIGVFRK